LWWPFAFGDDDMNDYNLALLRLGIIVALLVIEIIFCVMVFVSIGAGDDMGVCRNGCFALGAALAMQVV
jgi:hypothetical protein